MENRKYRMEFEVHYHEVNPYEKATPLTILHYLEDAAISHSEAVGQGFKRLRFKKQAWILNKWQLEMERYPVLGEKVTIETWSAGFERFYGTRDFLIIDKDQKIIGRATSLWIFYNTESKRPSRIPPDFEDAYGVDSLRAIKESLEDPTIGEGEQEEGNEQIFAVRRSDIDTNGHVNNANYLQWMLEVVPEDIYQNNHLTALEITYKKATTYGTSICSKCYVANPRDNNSAYRHVVLGNDDRQELAIAKTVWGPLK
ncbi:acyl-ACP thioesterase domain-containing protein [Desulfosporosinus sp.]|uniref:acyl-[acyl-carrier-protein] thioesterase n=1 Tax=Desulfosporosinus sp. TaxID=157907 RepID=UPI00230BC2EE|nr:acyl-ACP thioesterase domain-containing protein [Desulfosporosinus sp.]MDA8220214.1 thioesterase [Desulfitobacterium hafniense]